MHQEEGTSQDKVFHLPQNVQSNISNVRVRLQILVWRAADKTAPPEFTVNQLLSSFSWKMEEDILVPSHGCVYIAPKSLLQLVACGYASQLLLVRDQVVVVGLVGYHVPHTVGVKVMNSVLTAIPLPNRIHMAETDEENEDAHEVAD